MAWLHLPTVPAACGPKVLRKSFGNAPGNAESFVSELNICSLSSSCRPFDLMGPQYGPEERVDYLETMMVDSADHHKKAAGKGLQYLLAN